jgi:hypothetical protein
VRVLEPWVVYLKPMHENPEQSWFDTTGRIGLDTAVARSPRKPLGLLRALLRRVMGAVMRFGHRREPGWRGSHRPDQAADGESRAEEHGAPTP